MDKNKIKSMSREERHACLLSLSRDDEAGLSAFYRECGGLDAAYCAHFKPLYQEWTDYIKGSAVVNEARMKWCDSDDDTRLKILGDIQKNHSKMMGYASVSLAIMDIEGTVHPAKDGVPERIFTLHGFIEIEHMPDGDISPMTLAGGAHIIMNINASSTWSNFDMSLTTVIHENTHAHQIALINRLQKGFLTEGDDLYFQAQMFKANFERYVMGSDPVSYQNQPVEKEAMGVGEEMIVALRANRMKYGLSAKFQKVCECKNIPTPPKI